MNPNSKEFRHLLVRALSGQPISWSTLERRASQVILFGSRAVGVARLDSDWDLLCVGEGMSAHNEKIDLIWISPAQLKTDRWLGSELASHVASYGQWLVGEDSWSHRASISPEAVHHKRLSVLFQLSELKRLWPSIMPGWRAKHLLRLRRDVQRLHHLIEKRAVPPTRILDDLWKLSEMPLEDPDFLLKEVLRIAPDTE